MAEKQLVPPHSQLVALAETLRGKGHVVEEEKDGTLKVGRVLIELFPPKGCVPETGVEEPFEDAGDRPWRYGISGRIGMFGGADVLNTPEEVLQWLTGVRVCERIAEGYLLLAEQQLARDSVPT
jgi:hypothetical protein